MIITYFDRNVFADICELRRGITESDVGVIKQAVVSQSIIIPASITLIEETIRVIEKSDDDYTNHIKTVLGLVDKRFMVKPYDDLLIDAFYSYAEKKHYEMLIRPYTAFRNVLDLSTNRDDLIKLAKEITQQAKDSAAAITKALLLARASSEERNVGTPKDFMELWGGNATEVVSSVLQRVPRPIRSLCKKHGLKKMLEIKSLRLYAIYYLSLIHSGCFGIEGNPRKVKEGDIGDFHHVVQASVADIFVTQESKDRRDKLPYILNQVPTKGFTIMSLNEFIEFISQ